MDKDIKKIICLQGLAILYGIGLGALAAYIIKHDPEASLQQQIDRLEQVYAPDKRRALWQISLQKDKKGRYLRGITNQRAALGPLRALGVRDSLELWPDTVALAGQLHGVVHNSVANLRSKPKHSAELVTQALLGTPLRLLGKKKTWFLVQTPDEYIAWIDTWEFTAMTPEEFQDWLRQKKLFYEAYGGYAYASPSEEVPTSDLVIGAILSRTEKEQGQHLEILYPDGRLSWVRKHEVIPLEERFPAQTGSYLGEYMRSAAPQMIGLPYLWGGTSIKGMDCSGFTKTLFFLEGWIIPRDASQQAEEGDSVDLSQGWDGLEPGDLLFFGRKDNRRSYVTHVGLWMGDRHFIHASGRVRKSSVDPSDLAYDSAHLARFLYAKRYKKPSQRLIPYTAAGLYYKE